MHSETLLSRLVPHTQAVFAKCYFEPIMLFRQGSHAVHSSSATERSRPVMLSPCALLRVNSAKHLAAGRARPFAALRVTRWVSSHGQGLFFTLEPCLNFLIGISSNASRADQSAVCAINRHLRMSRLFFNLHYRSTSPTTKSRLPRMAMTSLIWYPRSISGRICRFTKEGPRSFARQGYSLPSLMR
jgi:hypothetical protein